MAETLGSLIDKLTIKSLRELYIKDMIKAKKKKFSRKNLGSKLKILKNQKYSLLREIEQFVDLALQRKVILKDEKLKLYNKPQMIDKIGKINNLNKAIDALAKKNLELWCLEDEARREDVSLEYVGKIKKKIDFANQQRNDLIDKIDGLFENKIKKYNKQKKR